VRRHLILVVRPMKNFLTLLVIALLLCACKKTTNNSSTNCFKDQTPLQGLDKVELETLTQSKLRAKNRCASSMIQCGFYLEHMAAGQIGVQVMSSGMNCVGLPGNFKIYVYDKNGKYLRTEPGA
jgi:uncharacterized Fe-S center protein